MAQAELFNVVQFFPDGSHEYIQQGLPVEEALRLVCNWIAPTRPAHKLGIIERVIITDMGDITVFEWKKGIGITFPRSAAITAWNTTNGFTGVDSHEQAKA